MNGEGLQDGENAQPQDTAPNQVEDDGGDLKVYVMADGGAACGYVEADGGAVKESISANLDDTERDQYKPKMARLRKRV